MPTYKGNMMTCMKELPDYLIQMINQKHESIHACASYLASQDLKQIYVSGSGTSYHASLAAKRFMEELMNLKVSSIYPMQYIDNERVFEPEKAAFIGISHSGTSTSTIQALEKSKNLNMATIACSAVEGSVLYKYGESGLVVCIGEEDIGPKTKGYLGCTLILQLLAIEYALIKGTITQNQAEEYESKLKNIFIDITSIQYKTVKWYENNKDELMKAKRIIVTGYDENLPSVLEGTLKVLETIRRSVVGYELEEFLHGIYNSIDQDTYMIYLASDGKYYQRLLNLKSYLDEKTTHQFMITFDKTKESKQNLVYDFHSGEFSQYQYIIPMQMLAYLLSKDLGIDCNVPSDPLFHKKMNSKLI